MDAKAFDIYAAAAMTVVSNTRIAEGNFDVTDDFFEQVLEMAERMVFESAKREKEISARKQYEKEWSFERLDLK